MNFQLITKGNILLAGQNQPSYAGPTAVKILKRAAIQRKQVLSLIDYSVKHRLSTVISQRETPHKPILSVNQGHYTDPNVLKFTLRHCGNHKESSPPSKYGNIKQKDQDMNDTAGPRTLGSTPHESERKTCTMP